VIDTPLNNDKAHGTHGNAIDAQSNHRDILEDPSINLPCFSHTDATQNGFGVNKGVIIGKSGRCGIDKFCSYSISQLPRMRTKGLSSCIMCKGNADFPLNPHAGCICKTPRTVLCRRMFNNIYSFYRFLVPNRIYHVS
jgi:hypothetical protein